MTTDIIGNSKKDNTTGYKIGAMGGRYPVVEINGYNLTEKQIKSVDVNSSDFIPTINCTFEIKDGVFISKHFPKDGDVISVYIRSHNNDLKPVRCDFLISRVVTGKSKDSQGSKLKITVLGNLLIPRLYKSFNKSFKNMSSLDVMTEIANDLGLGLVTNITATELVDTMTWVAANETYAEFIKKITDHAYLNEFCFFKCWIDYYYNLNFVDLNRMHTIADSEPTSDGINFQLLTKDYDEHNTIEYIKDKNILTNLTEVKAGGNYIEKHEFINNAGDINTKMGYINNVNFFDFELGTHVNFDIEATTTESTTIKKIAPKGRMNEETYKDEVKKIWAGWCYNLENHNTHTHYIESEYQNILNNNQLDKLKIKVYLTHVNLNYYIGQRVPIVFVNTHDSTRIEQSGYPTDKADETGFSIDRFLSGNYVIQGINLTFKNNLTDKPAVKQEMILTRREWSHPKLYN